MEITARLAPVSLKQPPDFTYGARQGSDIRNRKASLLPQPQRCSNSPFCHECRSKALCLQHRGMDKYHLPLRLPKDTGASSVTLMQGNCFSAFNDKRYCMKIPGGMLKNRLNNAFPRTAEGFLPSPCPVGERCHLMSWKPQRSYSLAFLSAYQTIFSHQAPHLLQPSFMALGNQTY